MFHYKGKPAKLQPNGCSFCLWRAWGTLEAGTGGLSNLSETLYLFGKRIFVVYKKQESSKKIFVIRRKIKAEKVFSRQ